MSKIRFYICKRFMLADFPNYLTVSDVVSEEIVSVDCSLFPYDEQREFAGSVNFEEKEQLLAVLKIEKNDEIPTLEGFEFCGFDLAEADEFGVAGTSYLTNCSHSLYSLFSFVKVNKYGLLDGRQEAERLQTLLPKQYPDEPHAYCEIFAIWRKKSIFLSFESKKARRAYGGSAFMELQYCKLNQSASIKKILSNRSIPYWQNDGLYIYVDDMDCFLSNYEAIFGDAVLSNSKGAKGINPYGVNYFSPVQLKSIIDKVEKQKQLNYDVLLEWLKKGLDYNGFYILGI